MSGCQLFAQRLVTYFVIKTLFSRSIPLRPGYCSQKHHLSYVILMQSGSVQFVPSFRKVVFLAVFANIKPLSVNVNCVLQSLERTCSCGFNKTMSSTHFSLSLLFSSVSTGGFKTLENTRIPRFPIFLCSVDFGTLIAAARLLKLAREV